MQLSLPNLLSGASNRIWQTARLSRSIALHSRLACKQHARCRETTSFALVSRTYAAQMQSDHNEKDKTSRDGAKSARITDLFQRVQTATQTFNNVYARIAQTSYGRLMRLDKPIGHNLLFLPGAWGISIASSSPLEFLSLSCLFYGGAILMRGAGCTINDIWDVDIDRKVERTKSRPIASGEISTTSAFIFLGAQLTSSLWILTRLNTETFLIGSLSVLPVLFYPFAKRKTAYPQAVLAMTFNWGALMGYTAVTGTIGLPAVLLYGAGWCWTMIYDTIYAQQDKEDDRAMGDVFSTAITFGQSTKPILAALTAAKFAFLTGAGLVSDLSLPYFMGITASTIHLGHQIYSTNLSSPSECQKAFMRSQTTGTIIWGSILAGRIF